MPAAQQQSTRKKECQALQTFDGSGCCPICINDKWYVPWTFPTLNVHDSSAQGICRPCNNSMDGKGNNSSVSNIEYETAHQNAILNDMFLLLIHSQNLT